MSESKPTIQIDTDWKRQAQEEKQRLAEEERKKSSASSSTASGRLGGSSESSRSRRELPPPSFETLVQSIATQVAYYLGELTPSGGEPTISLEMARHHIDTLAVLEAKTKGNLTPDEQRLLDLTLYELRMRFVGVAQQMIR
jgi:hypothetical protein